MFFSLKKCSFKYLRKIDKNNDLWTGRNFQGGEPRRLPGGGGVGCDPRGRVELQSFVNRLGFACRKRGFLFWGFLPKSSRALVVFSANTAKLNQGFLKPVGTHKLKFQGLETLVLWLDRHILRLWDVLRGRGKCHLCLAETSKWLHLYTWGCLAQPGPETTGRVEPWARKTALWHGHRELTLLIFSSVNWKMEICGINSVEDKIYCKACDSGWHMENIWLVRISHNVLDRRDTLHKQIGCKPSPKGNGNSQPPHSKKASRRSWIQNLSSCSCVLSSSELV